MASFRVEWKQSAKKELRKLPDQARRRILTVVDGLTEDPLPPDSRKLIGLEQTYRLRVGDYRVIYSFRSSALCVEIIRVADRKEAYR
jgi:mRNA interferase RelE/StbE